jgi:hypothetical protein
MNVRSDVSGIWRQIKSKSWMARRCQCAFLKTSVKQMLGYSALAAGKDVNIFRTRRVSVFSHHHLKADPLRLIQA